MEENSLSQQIEDLQKQITQQEKLASLGMLTAGIMHEIRNPLNFVINFSKLSNGLLKDLIDDIKRNETGISQDDLDDIQDIVDNLEANLQKIEEHGTRAINIIQNILLYSRGKGNERIPSDIVQLVKEYVWLGYHAMRANFKNFNVTIEEDYQNELPLISVIPQDLSRAVLNILNNAYYAVWDKSLTAGSDYRPCVKVNVFVQDNELHIKIEDNGKGMTNEVKQRLFESFFTTKPAGHGTGLGLSITREIIEIKHEGRIEFDSTENVMTYFVLIIPIRK